MTELPSMGTATDAVTSVEHEWTLTTPPDSDDPSESEAHTCSRCGVVRYSEWGTLPVYGFKSPKWGPLIGPTDPGCKQEESQ